MRLTGGNMFIIKPVFYNSATHIADKTEDFICIFPVSSQSVKRVTVKYVFKETNYCTAQITIEHLV
jgi:hypothetical protein